MGIPVPTYPPLTIKLEFATHLQMLKIDLRKLPACFIYTRSKSIQPQMYVVLRMFSMLILQYSFDSEVSCWPSGIELRDSGSRITNRFFYGQ